MLLEAMQGARMEKGGCSGTANEDVGNEYYRSCYAPRHQPTSAVIRPAHPEELQVSQTAFASTDSLVVPHQPRFCLRALLLLCLCLPCHLYLHALSLGTTLEVCGWTSPLIHALGPQRADTFV